MICGRLKLKTSHCTLNKVTFNRMSINTINALIRCQSGIPSRLYSTVINLPGTRGQNTPFPKAYDPKYVEEGCYSCWEDRGYFLPRTDDTVPFSILLPPPNVTGTLHLGHALTTTIQDVLSRWHRMNGHSVMWVPGTDHAGIATQVVVEKKLWQEQKLTRHDLGRDKFLEEMWKWKSEKGGIIETQLRSLGASMDWSREVFTMDPVQSAAVTEAFIQLFNAGLIYRSRSLVNWSCILQSAISDIEVEYKEVTGATLLTVPSYDEPIEFGVLTDFAYKLCNKDGEIVVSTTRVETMLGDVAIAVHPDDERYKDLHGTEVWHPFRKTKIPIICDDFVDPEFGTGAVKITPSHDYTDYEVGKRHKLEMLSVISEDGKINNSFGMFAGLKRFEARQVVSTELEKLGLTRGRRDHNMQVPLCSRSGDVVEFLLKPQWFVNCSEMAERAVNAVRTGELQIEPVDFEKNWFHWLENIRDWCVSRQLWWGHRVPMYDCVLEGAVDKHVWIAARNVEDARCAAIKRMDLSEENAINLRVKQDDDVLDTWFSSALLPFSSFGWPNQTDDLKKFYPLSMMETGHDILFFWVARMVMLGTQLTGQLPFKKILLHGIVCDAHGRKMSKSLGNVIFPENVVTGVSLEDLNKQTQLSVDAGFMGKEDFNRAVAGQKKMFPNGIPECGTDALRFSLCSHNIKNHFINFDVNECHTNRLFCNKMWQACKYVKQATEKFPNVDASRAVDKDGGAFDRWILSRLSFMVTQVNHALEHNDLHVATAALKTFIYYDFCDVYLETTKPVLRSGEQSSSNVACETLLTCLDVSLRSLSPFMPFISEHLYQRLPRTTSHESIMIAPYPSHEQWMHWRDTCLEEEIDMILEIVTTIRRLKTTYNVSKQKASFTIVSANHQILYPHLESIKTLSDSRDVAVLQKTPSEWKSQSIVDTVGKDCVVHLSVEGLNVKEDQNKYALKQEKLVKELEKMLKISSTDGYKTKASPKVQKSHSDKIVTLQAEIKRLQEIQVTFKRISS